MLITHLKIQVIILLKVNNDVNIGTNNTIFIKDGIKFTGNGGQDKYLDIDYIRRIKYLPYHFDKEICIGNSCINKQHIKFMKGKIPFSISYIYFCTAISDL